MSTGALRPPAFTEEALCSQVDPEMFYPEKGDSTKDAKRVCMGCLVREECLVWALKTHERFGVWGGMSFKERKQLMKNSRNPAA